jgi:hypothetical protein
LPWHQHGLGTPPAVNEVNLALQPLASQPTQGTPLYLPLVLQ